MSVSTTIVEYPEWNGVAVAVAMTSLFVHSFKEIGFRLECGRYDQYMKDLRAGKYDPPKKIK